ncbi:MAG: hypothetical protein AABO57_17295 [Acidobacteriota bacterium]
MPKRAKLILDSGCFLPLNDKKQTYSQIGLFQCDKSWADFTVRVDGKEKDFPALRKLGSNCKIEVRHVNENGTAKKGRVTFPKTFHRRLLELKDLYGEHVPVNSKTFDCIVLLRTGQFSSKDTRLGRVFKKHTKRAKGRPVLQTRVAPKELKKPIMHDIVVRYSLEEGESIEFLRDGTPFWSTKEANAKQSIEIKINADESTVPKYFGDSFQTRRGELWLPNPSDPPPMCPNPPCEPE